MKNKVISGFLLAAIAFPAFAQDFAFRVMATKGANEVKSGASWQPIKGFMQIKLSDEVRVADNGYLGLMHQKGVSLEVRKAGNYKVTELVEKLPAGASLMNKYVDFMLSNNAEAKKNNLIATGAVHRGFGIDVYLPENLHSDIFNPQVTVKWEASKAGGPYVVAVTDMFGEEISRREQQETSAQFDLSKPEFARYDNILVTVYAKTDPSSASDSYLVKRLSKTNRETIQKSLGDLNAGFQEDNALKHFLLAAFFEEQKLFIDAIGEYETAIRMAPDVDYFRESFEDFLIRNRLKDTK